MVKQKGIRNGIDKKEIMKSMNEEDWKRIKLQKEIETQFVEDETAKACAVRSDQMFLQFDQLTSDLQGTIFNMLSAKTKLERNKQDILKKETDRLYPGTNNKMSLRDLEIENIHVNRLIADNRRNVWVLLANIFRYVGLQRLDKKIFFSKEQYTELAKKVNDELAKNSIRLFEDRY